MGTSRSFLTHHPQLTEAEIHRWAAGDHVEIRRLKVDRSGQEDHP